MSASDPDTSSADAPAADTAVGPTWLPRRLRDGRVVEFLRFCVVGSSGVITNLGSYAALTRLADIPIHLASPMAIELSVLWNFLLNDRWTFRERRIGRSWPWRLARFHAVCAFGGVLNYAVLLVMVEVFHWWDIYGNLLGIILSIGVKFAFNSQWTWRESRPTAPAATGKLDSAKPIRG